MKSKIVFFDIDGVIFNAHKFWNHFYAGLSKKINLDSEEAEVIKALYDEVKREKGFFDPETFLTKILSRYSISKVELEKLWWDDANFDDNLLVDGDFLGRIREKAEIGIFSKGELNFQKRKLREIQSFINEQNIFIFENKIVKIEEVANKYREYEVYVVDDRQDVLESFKKINDNVITILVDDKSTAKTTFIDYELSGIQDFPQILQ
jgi:FMN phosphatase YigB (HAD superfamily)